MGTIEGLLPSKQIQRAVERLRRYPPHPGILVRVECVGDSTIVSEAARQLNLPGPKIERILEGERGISPGLAVRMEALGWETANLRAKLQSTYDLAQARRRALRPA